MAVLAFKDESEWLQVRRRGVGGSDAAAVVGLSKWRTPLQVYYEKIGEAPPFIETEPMRWGKLLEPVLRQEYANQTGRPILQVEGVIQHDYYPFMLASLDGYTEDGRIVEFKTSRNGENWGDSEDDIPEDYLLQVQHYMAVTGYLVADVAVLIGGSDFRVYEVPADAEIQGLLIEREAQFWERVQKEKPPEPVSVSDLINFFTVKPGNITATPEIVEALHSLKAIKNGLKGTEETKEELEQKIKIYLGERDTLLDGSGKTLATWKQPKASQKFDTERFKQEHPDLYKEYLVDGSPSRRFLLK